jgi:hypothetical protein
MNFYQLSLLMEADLLLMERPAAKTGLYPWGYDGIGLFPPAYFIPSAADAIYYISIDDRILKHHEGPPFDITHIHSPDAVIEPSDHNMPGREVKPKSLSSPKLGKFKLPPGTTSPPLESPLPGKPKKDSLVKDVELVDPKHNGPGKFKSWD